MVRNVDDLHPIGGKIPGDLKEPRSIGIAASLRNIAYSLGRLVSEHIALARIELTEEATACARSAGQTAAFFALVLVGYAFVCGGLVAFLAPAWTSLPAALLIVGGANLIVGALGAYGGLRRIAKRRMMNETAKQLDQSISMLEAAIRSNGRQFVDDER
jgi:uncharacterized membrane protein YqjE